jgi:hypothetical protein
VAPGQRRGDPRQLQQFFNDRPPHRQLRQRRVTLLRVRRRHGRRLQVQKTKEVLNRSTELFLLKTLMVKMKPNII